MSDEVTKRDIFAAFALHALLSRSGSMMRADQYARDAALLADDLCAALDRDGPQ